VTSELVVHSRKKVKMKKEAKFLDPCKTPKKSVIFFLFVQADLLAFLSKSTS